MTKPTVHIIGSGISGLRCAENLLQSGIEVKIVEMTDSIGGRMRTTEKNGFLLDHGFHVMQTGYPHSKAEIDFNALGAKRFSPGAKIIKSSAGENQAICVVRSISKPYFINIGAIHPEVVRPVQYCKTEAVPRLREPRPNL